MFYTFIFASFEETNLTGFDFLKKLKYKSSYNTLSGCAEVLGPIDYPIEEKPTLCLQTITTQHYFTSIKLRETIRPSNHKVY